MASLVRSRPIADDLVRLLQIAGYLPRPGKLLVSDPLCGEACKLLVLQLRQRPVCFSCSRF